MKNDIYLKFNFSDIGDMQLMAVDEIDEFCNVCGEVTENFTCEDCHDDKRQKLSSARC
jgi:recombinational DNA repair protein RecR